MAPGAHNFRASVACAPFRPSLRCAKFSRLRCAARGTHIMYGFALECARVCVCVLHATCTRELHMRGKVRLDVLFHLITQRTYAVVPYATVCVHFSQRINHDRRVRMLRHLFRINPTVTLRQFAQCVFDDLCVCFGSQAFTTPWPSSDRPSAT